MQHDRPPGSTASRFRQQRTIAKPTRLTGFGYWSGKDVTVEFRPAPEHTGVTFVRCEDGDTDLSAPTCRIPACLTHRIEVPRRTTLVRDGASVEMIEHIMAALAGLQIDNCEVWVNAAEMPGCDGSSQAFVQHLTAAGIVEQNATRARLVVNDVTRVGNDECWVEARPNPAGCFSVKYRLDFGSDNPIGRQTLELPITPDTFCRELADARTFILEDEALWLREQGLGDRVSYRDLLVFDKDGPIENNLRYEDECVRHKTLDLVGDLGLAGCDIVGHVIAVRSGHRLNAALLKVLLTESQIEEDHRRVA